MAAELVEKVVDFLHLVIHNEVFNICLKVFQEPRMIALEIKEVKHVFEDAIIRNFNDLIIIRKYFFQQINLSKVIGAIIQIKKLPILKQDLLVQGV